jgi:hypothetical protein
VDHLPAILAKGEAVACADTLRGGGPEHFVG